MADNIKTNGPSIKGQQNKLFSKMGKWMKIFSRRKESRYRASRVRGKSAVIFYRLNPRVALTP
jgi:hypothetical protein